MASYDTVVGIDFGTYAIKVAWCGLRGKKPVVKRTELLKLPRDDTPVGDILTPWIEKMGVTGACVTGVSGAQVVFQPFSLPPDDPRTMEQGAEVEALKFNEIASETMTFGSVPFSLQPNERRMLLAMVRESVVAQSVQTAKDAGLDVIELVPLPVALFNAIESQTDEHASPHMHVNIGHSTTEIAVGSQGGLMFARAFAGGGRMFNSALAKSGGLSEAQADNLKVKEGSLVEGKSSTSAALTEAAGLWLPELQACLSVYRSIFPGEEASPQRIVLAGGGAELDGLPEYIAAQLNVETVRVGAVCRKSNKTDFGTFAGAIGLALSGLQAAGAPLSLLPANTRDELMFRRQKPFWLAAGVTAALILGASLGGGYRDIRRKEMHLKTQKISLQRRQGLVRRIESVKARSAQIQSMAVPVLNLLSSGPLARDVITLVAESKSPDDTVTMLADAKSYFSGSAERSSPSTKLGMRDHRRAAKPLAATPTDDDPGFYRIVIEGYTPKADLVTVKELIAKLEAAKFIASADLLSDDQVLADAAGGPLKGRDARRFVIDVKVAVQ